ncbi:MAG: beta-glucosidase [Candidatus Promineofilum sp.]|nr:beta-glucosidase [Promineifilum sp.]
MNPTHIQLPRDFLFGAATSAYQIEGGWDADGKGPSIWDRFSHQPGRIHNGDTGDTAAETYRDFQTDIDIMRGLGLDAYRFSIAWSRVMPDGRGRVNNKGLDYYDRLVDELLAQGLLPFPTLFHWDMPQALQDVKGGFAQRDAAEYFADYATTVVGRLGDRVDHWTTLNEPWVHATLGCLIGAHAPGRRNPWAYLRTVHYQLLAHGLAAARIRSLSPTARVGIALNLTPFYPAGDGRHDREAADMGDQLLNRLFLDPLFRGRYPDPLWRKMRLFQPRIRPGDMDLIAQPLDFLGVNYYTRSVLRYHRLVPLLHLWPKDLGIIAGLDVEAEGTYTAMGWEVYPAGLFETLLRLKKEYGNPTIYVTENGAAFLDTVEPDGRIRDEARRVYLEQHLAVVGAAARAGVDVRGYFVWSIIDNFEWAHGYDKRFGLVHVDFATQQRIIKDSGYWYARLIRAVHGAEADASEGEGTS